MAIIGLAPVVVEAFRDRSAPALWVRRSAGVFGVLAGAALMATAQAQDGPSLGIGDPAPALSVAEWVKGSQVSNFEAGSVYLVEFWATW